MSNYKDTFDDANGKPGLGPLQYLQDNWDADAIASAVRVEKITIPLSGTSGVTSTNIPVGSQILKIWNHAGATVGGGTVTVSVGGGGASISNAMAMAVVDAVTEATTIDRDNMNVVAAGVTATPNDNAVTGDVFVSYKK